ncbi:MAG: hypothetical protein P8Z50_08470, partial [candidate division WOR-3 bacterium]
AIEVLLKNSKGPYKGLPRTAGWGYPEAYTRDLMISSLGILVSGNKKLINVLRKVLKELAKRQTRLGHIPSLVNDPEDRGASDSTPLFLMAVAIFRKFTGEKNFLAGSVEKAMKWMEYQSPGDRVIVAQLPTSDWRVGCGQKSKDVEIDDGEIFYKRDKKERRSSGRFGIAP